MNDYYIEIIKRKLYKTVADNLLEYIKELEGIVDKGGYTTEQLNKKLGLDEK